jgi:dTMP kinase
MKAKFITFEGIEGCGKSTQAKKLHQFFLDQRIDVILTREPGGSAAGEKIRDILIDDKIPTLEVKTELLLNFAARIEHVEKVIKPAIAAGKIVICDRFFDSTYAYQGSAMGLDYKLIDDLRQKILGDFAPDLTFLINVPIEEAFERIKNRSDNNRYEKLGLDFHKKVCDGFLKMAKNHPRIKLINGSQPLEVVFTELLNHLS